MECQKPLSDLYQLYKKGKLSRKEFEGRIFEYLLDNFEGNCRFTRYHGFNGSQERWNEFLSWLYPRVARAIDLYRDMGSSFDAYVTSLIYSASKEYRCREAEHRVTEYVCWQARAEEMAACESGNEYLEEQQEISIPEGIKPRQVLLLLLKSYYFVSDEFVKRVAPAIGMKSEEIQTMVDEVKKLRSQKDTEILDMRERLYCQHYRCLTYQKRMENAQPGTVYYERMKGRFERAKRRFTTMRKRLGGMRLDASNRMIAEVVGIPKGTVDSGLFAVTKHFSGSRREAV